MYGDATLDKVVLCTTHWGEVPSEEEDGRETEMQERHWKSMVQQGSQVQRFTRDQQSARDILSIFLPQAAWHNGNPSLGVKNSDRTVPNVNATGAGRSSKRTHKTNSQDKILENGKETDIVIPFVIASCSIGSSLKPITVLWAHLAQGRAQ